MIERGSGTTVNASSTTTYIKSHNTTQHAGKARTFVVPDRTAETLIPIIVATVRPGTLIISDTYAPYFRLGRDYRYRHLMVNHSLEFVNRHNRFIHTETI